ncbi:MULTISPECIES: hypothetical protein [unclassified Streptomyces]|uniref:hypothetical protein n=1 Tax=unclassified Streptomyces TaxID=2593676 RepID=UPI0033BA66F0
MTYRAHRLRWRYWAHRGGLIQSTAYQFLGVPYGTAGQHRRRRDKALARLARTERTGCTPGCTTCQALADRARK